MNDTAENTDQTPTPAERTAWQSPGFTSSRPGSK